MKEEGVSIWEMQYIVVYNLILKWRIFAVYSLQLHIYCQLKNELLQTDGKIVTV